MWRTIKTVFAVSILTFSLGMTISSSFAQDTTRDGVVSTPTTTRDMRDNNDGFDLGWIGLAGLAGLAGLMPRDRHDRIDHGVKR